MQPQSPSYPVGSPSTSEIGVGPYIPTLRRVVDSDIDRVPGGGTYGADGVEVRVIDTDMQSRALTDPVSLDCAGHSRRRGVCAFGHLICGIRKGSDPGGDLYCAKYWVLRGSFASYREDHVVQVGNLSDGRRDEASPSGRAIKGVFDGLYGEYPRIDGQLVDLVEPRIGAVYDSEKCAADPVGGLDGSVLTPEEVRVVLEMHNVAGSRPGEGNGPCRSRSRCRQEVGIGIRIDPSVPGLDVTNSL